MKCTFENYQLPTFKEIIAGLDATPLCVMVAGDVAGYIRKRIRSGELKPALKQATFRDKMRDTVHNRGFWQPVYRTGLLADHIFHMRKGFNCAIVFLAVRYYGEQEVRTDLVKDPWGKPIKGKYRHGWFLAKSIGKQRQVSIWQVTQWQHNGTGRIPARPFWDLPPREILMEFVENRFNQWIDDALNKVVERLSMRGVVLKRVYAGMSEMSRARAGRTWAHLQQSIE